MKPRIFKRGDVWVLVVPTYPSLTMLEHKAESFDQAVDLLDLWIWIWHFRTFRRLAASVGGVS